MRINKYLAECGVASRRNSDELVKQGRVKVNKKLVTQPGFEVNENNDVVYVDGKKVTRVSHYDYIMFNKPKGCVTTADDDKDTLKYRPRYDEEGNLIEKDPAIAENTKKRKTVYSYLEKDFKNKRLFPVGRLDYDSEGLLLFTNDGQLANALTHPSSEISKTYVVKIEGEIQESDLAALRNGVTVDGVKYNRCKVKITDIEKVIEDNGNVHKFTRLEVTIFEGKNREIRNMFSAVEKNVIFLKRVAIGELRLGGVSRGGYRNLNEYEVAYLKKLCGIKE